jgi:hypothetical protein
VTERSHSCRSPLLCRPLPADPGVSAWCVFVGGSCLDRGGARGLGLAPARAGSAPVPALPTLASARGGEGEGERVREREKGRESITDIGTWQNALRIAASDEGAAAAAVAAAIPTAQAGPPGWRRRLDPRTGPGASARGGRTGSGGYDEGTAIVAAAAVLPTARLFRL